MTERELDEILTLRWPWIVREVMAEGTDSFLMSFVRSIARNGKRRNWRPSPKQEAIMRRLLAERRQPIEADCDVIER